MLVGQNEAGCLLCLLSKNEESAIRKVFRHDKMAGLDWSHWAAVRVDWSSKPSNLRDVCERLGLGLDSVFFLDDHLVECAAKIGRASCRERVCRSVWISGLAGPLK